MWYYYTCVNQVEKRNPGLDDNQCKCMLYNIIWCNTGFIILVSQPAAVAKAIFFLPFSHNIVLLVPNGFLCMQIWKLWDTFISVTLPNTVHACKFHQIICEFNIFCGFCGLVYGAYIDSDFLLALWQYRLVLH
jgi:hypothetical protein